MRKLVMMCDAEGMPRAYGVAPDEETARKIAQEQLKLYIERKRPLNDPSYCLDPAGYSEEVKDCA